MQPYVAVRLHCELPYSKLLPIEDEGHFPCVEQPEGFSKDVREFFPKLENMSDSL